MNATPERLGPDAIKTWLAAHPAWRLKDGGLALTRRFTFADFSAAWGFMSRLALHAEQHGHHPEWANVYDRVDLRLTTHDAGGVTPRDLALAGFADAVAATLPLSAG